MPPAAPSPVSTHQWGVAGTAGGPGEGVLLRAPHHTLRAAGAGASAPVLPRSARPGAPSLSALSELIRAGLPSALSKSVWLVISARPLKQNDL